MPTAVPKPPEQPLSSGSTKIILFVFLSTFVTALVVGAISIQSTHSFHRQQIQRDFSNILTVRAEALDLWFTSGSQALDSAPTTPEALARWLDTSRYFDAGYIVTTEGETLSAVGRSDPLGELGPLPALNTGGVQAVGIGEFDSFAVARVPLAGETQGELVARFDREELVGLLASKRDGIWTAMTLFDAAGRLVAGSGGNAAMESAAPGNVDVDPFLSAPEEVLRTIRRPSGTRVVESFVRLTSVPWRLRVAAPVAAAFAPVSSVIARILVIDLVIILLFSYLAYRITATMMRPIEALSDGARRISQGQLDVEIRDPETHDEIGLLTRTFNDMVRKLRRNRLQIEAANERLTTQNEELQLANEVLAQLSITDGLTKLHNHRYFQDHLTREIKRVSRSDEPLAILLADLDDFKQLNDRYGHAAGDELLVRVAKIMSSSIRESDLLARYGGEEFVVLAPDTDATGAVNLAEKVRTAVAENSYIIDESMRPVRVTVSIGVAIFEGSRKEFFQAADRALYSAKAEGKNCVVFAEDDWSPQL